MVTPGSVDVEDFVVWEFGSSDLFWIVCCLLSVVWFVCCLLSVIFSFVSCSALAVEAGPGTLSFIPPDDDVEELFVSGLRSGTQSLVTPDDDSEELDVSDLRSGGS